MFAIAPRTSHSAQSKESEGNTKKKKKKKGKKSKRKVKDKNKDTDKVQATETSDQLGISTFPSLVSGLKMLYMRIDSGVIDRY